MVTVFSHKKISLVFFAGETNQYLSDKIGRLSKPFIVCKCTDKIDDVLFTMHNLFYDSNIRSSNGTLWFT